MSTSKEFTQFAQRCTICCDYFGPDDKLVRDSRPGRCVLHFVHEQCLMPVARLTPQKRTHLAMEKRLY